MTSGPSARRRLLLKTGGAALAAWATRSLANPKYPGQPVRMLVPHPAGQAADIFSRMLAERLTSMWGQQVVVDNRPGGAGLPAIAALKASKPDGYTMMMGTSSTLSINSSVFSNLPYDTLRDFAPVSNVIIAPFVVVAHPAFPARTIAELVAQAKREPGITFASTGAGSAQHMTGELFRARARIKLTHIPYKGSAAGIIDLIGGQVPLMFDSVAATLPFIRSGQVKAIAVTTLNRVAHLPHVPTIAESGYPGLEGAGWAGIVLPVAAPRPVVMKVSADIQTALNDPQMKARIVERAAIPDPRSPEDFAAFIRSETAKWKRVAQEAQVRLD
jgi:tripartite-type tricarboxylate transporter receptor subunit TctC